MTEAVCEERRSESLFYYPRSILYTSVTDLFGKRLEGLDFVRLWNSNNVLRRG